MPSIYAKDSLCFNGKADELLPFLDEFEILAEASHLTMLEMDSNYAGKRLQQCVDSGECWKDIRKPTRTD